MAVGGRPTRRNDVPRILLTLAAGLLLALSLAFAARALAVPVKAQLAQWLLQRAWARSAAEQGALVRPWSWADAWPVARLRVGDAEHIVLAGTEGSALAFAPAWLAGTAPVGTPGTTVIAAHRDTHFRGLQRVRPGDLIEVQTVRGEVWRYRVGRPEIRDTRNGPLVLRDDGQRHLALVTCYPFDGLHPGGPLRYVLWATAVGHDDAPDHPARRLSL